MIYLSDDAIKYAFSDCINQNNYKVLIVASNKIIKENVIKTIESYISTYIKEDYIFSFTTDMSSNCIVKFTNGSTINLVHHSETNRGRKCNLLIMDFDIDKETVKHTYRNVEIKRYCKRKSSCKKFIY